MTLDEARDADFAEQREAMLQWQRDCERHFSLRDHFAAAALTGLVANGDYSVESTPLLAWRMADAMLHFRDSRTENNTDHDAAPAATATLPTGDHASEGSCNAPKMRTDSGTGDTFVLDAYRRFVGEVMNWISEATSIYEPRSDGGRRIMAEACMQCWNAFDRIAYPTTNHDAVPAAIASVESVVPQPTTRGDSDRTDKAAPRPSEGTGNTPVAESATPDGYAYSGWPYPKGKMASISDAEIDALEFVVEEGRIASQMDYGVLRSLLVRLRPEWLDRPEPIKDEESDRSKPIAYTPPTHATPGECSSSQEGTRA